MADVKVVIGVKDGKSHQRVLSGNHAEALLGKKIDDSISGDALGFPGFEFLITGGSDKSGFPMRKGIQLARKTILIGKGIGFAGKDRNEKKQPGLMKRRTVCGDTVTKDIQQVNLKVTKEGLEKLESPAKEQ
ncbi:TPA: 30S ribosomal protein S6e [Candidatus Woesearchaeota archaeon]|nr:30S ribosomal protein S6e [Candidatus Woesearchaeota archaeon]